MSKATTRATINANIKQNGVQAITGPVLNSVLNAMVDDYGTQGDLDALRGDLTAFQTEVGKIAVNVAYKGHITDLGATMLQISKKVSLINVISGADVYAAILPSSMVNSGWLYEYEEGWRLGKVGGFPLTSTSTWENLLDWLDGEGNSTKIVGETALNELRDEVAKKADKSGRYPAMSVGSAEALVSRGSAVAEEFLTKIASASGASEVKALKGNSLVWNQHTSPNGINETTFTNGVKAYTEGDHIVVEVASGGATATRDIDIADYHYSQSGVSGHIRVYGGAMNPTDKMQFVTGYSAVSLNSVISASVNAVYCSVRVLSGCQAGKYIFRPQVIDLTQMFGAGKEPSTYAEFLAMSPKVADPFAYNEGVIVSSNPSGIKTTGKQLWDEDWRGGYTIVENGKIRLTGGSKDASSNIRCARPIAVVGGLNYYVGGNGGYNYGIGFSDNDDNYLGGNEWTTATIVTAPLGATKLWFYRYVETPDVYRNDIIVACSDVAVPYEPYDGHLLPMDLSAIKKDGVSLFPNGLLSAGTAYDEVRKNKAVKRFGVKVFDGTENWRFTGAGSGLNENQFYSNFNEGHKAHGQLLSAFYRYGDPYSTNMTMDTDTNSIYIRDENYASLDAWKAHLADLYAQGKPLEVIYELAEPIVVDTDFNGVFLTTQNGIVEVLDSVPMKADIVDSKDYIGIIEDLVRRVEALEG